MNCRILQGDCRDVLKTLPEESVNCIVTSPPYWGLRDYGTANWTGGKPDCDHRVLYEKPRIEREQNLSNRGNRRNEFGGPATDAKDEARAYYRGKCGKCGAVRIDQQLGLERSPEEYIARMVEVFREARRVLHSDGTLWLNIGDSYANDGKWGGSTGGKHVAALHGNAGGNGRGKRDTGLKPKDLVGIPWMLAFALRADGWWLRSDIIWAKPNPMPESVTDRPTKSHEYIFLLAKSERYFYDAEAIKEPILQATAKDRVDTGVFRPDRGFPGGPNAGCGRLGDQDVRNKRSVWTIATSPFPEAHFATFPPDLIEPCIKAGCPEGGTVLDPFSGAGTTGVVARRFQRNYIGIELNEEYCAMSEKRITEDAPLFNTVAQS